MKKEVLLSAIMTVMAIAAMADEYTDPQTNVVYTYVPGQTTASVKAGYEEVAGDVVILDKFTVGTTEYVVTNIGYAAFQENNNIKSVSIPETVTDIGMCAFTACKSLTEVHLPEGLTQIAPYLFTGCSSLTTLNLPKGLTIIGREAFNDTPWYAALYKEAPDGPFYIGSQLIGYKGDKPTGELVIKEGTTCVGFEALLGCNGLTSITFPKSVSYVDYEAFLGCTGLKAVHITDLAAWCSIEFQSEVRSSSNPLNYAHHLYLNGKEVTNLVIPECVTSIGNFAFDNCTALTSVTIPDGVSSIGSYAFRNCEKLTSVTIPSSLATIGGSAFIWCFNLEAVHISDLAAWCGITLLESAVNPLNYGAHLYLNGKEVTDIVIPEGVTCINNLIFKNFAHLTSVTIPNGVTSIGKDAFYGCSGLTSVTFPRSLVSIGEGAFQKCSSLASVTIPDGVTNIGLGAFFHCHSLTSIVIPSSVSSIGRQAFFACWPLTSVVSMIEEPFEIVDDVFELYDEETHKRYFPSATLYVPKGCKARYESTGGWKNFKEIVELPAQDDYRPFVEEGKVWKVGNTQTILDNSVQVVDYYYFAGDTIIDGKICKQMMCQRFVNPNHPYYEYFPKSPSKVGAWYEENKKIYFYDETRQSTRIMYDFSLAANDTLLFLTDWSSPFIIGPKQTGGIDGFKGVYRDIRMCGEEGQSYHDTFWLEGVGCIRGPISNPCDPILGDPKPEFLMSCTVGDEIIYLNDEVEDGASPEGTGARKKRFDFTHTIKIQPKARKRSEELSLYGEYNDLQLGINLAPLDDAYQVRITDESGKAVYEKSVNAGSIVGLNIDISAYAEGRYTVTVENSQESFTGEFDTQTTGISDATRLNDKEKVTNDKRIYNLQGQRLSSLQKGLNIVNGQKIYVK